MLLTFGKIKTITKDHPILNPSLDKPMDFYNGYYYVKDNIFINDGNGYLLEPGFLEVYISYTSLYEENINTEYYVNYKHITTDGRIYNWRYYLNKDENTVYRLNKNDRPNLILTKNKIDKLLYSENEMSQRFLNRFNSGFEVDSNFIRIPQLKSQVLNNTSTSGDFLGDTLLEDNNTVKIQNLNKDLNFNKLFKSLENRSIYIDDNIHPNETFSSRWVDLFNLGSVGLWDDIYKRGLKVSDANGQFYPSHRNVYGINPNINMIYGKLGECFTDVGSLSDTGKYNLYKIDHNTYLPGISYARINYDLTQDLINYPRYNYNFEENPFYMVRLYSTPDEEITKDPVVFYGPNSANYIENNKYNTVNETRNDVFNNSYVSIDRNKPRQWEMGILMTAVHKKTDINKLFIDYKNNIISKSFNSTTFSRYKDLFSNITWGKWFLNNTSDKMFKDDLHIHLFDIDPNKVFYRSHSTEVDNDSYITYMSSRIEDSDAVTDIRFGPEIRTTYDKTEVNLDNSDRFIDIVNSDSSMALTYFKAEINKKSPRYTLENQAIVYNAAYPEQQDFVTRMNNRFKLKDNEVLGIDKITVGFRPIQIKTNGIWKNISKRGEGRR